jgi:fructoselysine and glucoselysine-specific PTS system IIA component
MIVIILSHKNLAQELVITAKSIVGHDEDIYPFTNHTKTTEQLFDEVREFLHSKKNPSEVLFMVDLRGGNCWTVARKIIHENKGYYVISGVNLPMVISFLTKKDNCHFEELVKLIEKDACRGTFLEK